MYERMPQLIRLLTDLAYAPGPIQQRMEQALAALYREWNAYGIVFEAARRFESLPPFLGYPEDLPLGEEAFRHLMIRAPSLNTATLFTRADQTRLPIGTEAAIVLPVHPGQDRTATLVVLFAKEEDARKFDIDCAEAIAQVLGFVLQSPSEPTRLSWSDPRVQSVIEIGRTLAATLDIDDLAPRTYKLIGEIMALDSFFVAYYEAESDTLEYRYLIQNGVTYPVERLSAEGTLAKTAIQAARPVHYYLPVTARDDKHLRRWGDPERFIRSILIVPIFEDGEPVATISAQTYQEYAYTAEDEQLLSIIGSYFAIAARNAGRLASSRAESLTDDLTGLGNRRALRLTLQESVERFRQTGEPHALILFDADSLKGVNDTYGHLAGDKFLVAIAKQIRSHLRDSDHAFRHGGDEFGACLAGVTSDHARQIAQRIVDAVSQTPIEFAGSVFSGRVSAGVAELQDGSHAVDAWYAAADAAAYAAKNQQPGSVQVAQCTGKLTLPPVAATSGGPANDFARGGAPVDGARDGGGAPVGGAPVGGGVDSTGSGESDGAPDGGSRDGDGRTEGTPNGGGNRDSGGHGSVDSPNGGGPGGPDTGPGLSMLG